jgi:hypothetical protein
MLMWGAAPTFLKAEEAFELARGLEADRTLELGDFEREAVAEEDLDGVLERPREDIVVVYMIYLPPPPWLRRNVFFLGSAAPPPTRPRAHDVRWVLSIA